MHALCNATAGTSAHDAYVGACAGDTRRASARRMCPKSRGGTVLSTDGRSGCDHSGRSDSDPALASQFYDGPEELRRVQEQLGRTAATGCLERERSG